MGKLFSLYALNKAVFWILAICLPILICLIYHFHFKGRLPKTSLSKPIRFIRRFNIREMISHWAVLLLFLLVIATGIMQIFAGESMHHIGPLHGYSGLLLLVLFLVNFTGWFKDMVFKSYDIEWLSSLGGYCSRNQAHLPAGRFNAGQKIFFWLILLALVALLISAIAMEHNSHGTHSLVSRQSLAWSIHGLTGCIATAMVIGHAYLSVLANPQTARVLFRGTVEHSYAEEHHSQWTALRK